MTDTRWENFDLASFSQLVQELITGSVRRHTFKPWELDFLLELQRSRIRKASKQDILRRYLRAVHQQFAEESSLLQLSAFLEKEQEKRTAASALTSAEISARPYVR